jgi:hypothetical protein
MEVVKKLTFWDLLETLVSGSHDCGVADWKI